MCLLPFRQRWHFKKCMHHFNCSLHYPVSHQGAVPSLARFLPAALSALQRVAWPPSVSPHSPGCAAGPNWTWWCCCAMSLLCPWSVGPSHSTWDAILLCEGVSVFSCISLNLLKLLGAFRVMSCMKESIPSCFQRTRDAGCHLQEELMMFQDVVGAPVFSEVANVWSIGFETQEEVPFILEDWSICRVPCRKFCSPESLQPSTICSM